MAYDLALNELSYWSYEDLIRQKTGSIETNVTGIPYEQAEAESIESVESTEKGNKRVRRAAAVPLTRFSWLDTAGVVQAVQNQNSCGSCWAFAGKILKLLSFLEIICN